MDQRYGTVKQEAARIGEISTRTYTHPGVKVGAEMRGGGSWLVVGLNDRNTELSFTGPGGADLAEDIGQALVDGARELRERIAREGR